MGTIFKITFANIGRKKFRTALIILSIILSVALLYTVLSMSQTITGIMEQKIKRETGSSELILSQGENAASPFLKDLDFGKIQGLSYHIPKLSAFGYSKIKNKDITVVMNGMDYKDYTTMYPVKFVEREEDGLNENQIMIGSEAAKEYDLNLGDEIKVRIMGMDQTFHISGIMQDQHNNLGYNLGSLSILISRDTLTELLQLNHQVSNYYIKAEKPSDLKLVQKDLEQTFPDLTVTNLSEDQDYMQMVNMITSCLMLMVFAVIMISIFIIYSSFKIIVIERMPMIGTLRSIGATKRKTIAILLLEATFYGLIGGIIGSLLGILLLTGTITVFLKNFGVTLENVSYVNYPYLAFSLVVGLLLMLLSAVLPIIKTNNKSIRSIIFSEIHNEKHLSIIKTVVGALLIGIAFLLFHLAPLELRMGLDALGILLVSIGSALIVPMLSTILSNILSLLFRPIFKDALGVTTANIKSDRTMMNNISLLAMGLGVILMINNFSSSVSGVVCDLYAKGKADIISFYPVDDTFIDQTRKVEGVEHVYTTREVQKVKTKDGKVTIPLLEGIDGKNYSKYAWDEFGSYLNDKTCKEFTNTRSIIVSNFLAKKYKLKEGNSLNFDFNGTTKSYKILKIVPSIMDNGSLSYVNEKFLKEDAQVNNYYGLYINLKNEADSEHVIQQIKELMPSAILPLQSLEDMQEQNVKSNNAIFFLMKAISLIAMFIGVVGILNNFTISFLSRKKLIATLRSLGLSKSKTIRNLIFEAFLCGCLGTISGLAFGTVLLQAMSYMIEALGIPSDVLFLSLNDFVFVFFSGILLSIASAILPAISIVKENIVAGLRYE
jgi:ABC-type transport system, involved in lipoprotein release, permease component